MSLYQNVFFTSLIIYSLSFIRNASFVRNKTSTILLLSLGRYICCWSIISRGLICPVICVSSLTWFAGYTYYWELHSLSHVIIINTGIGNRSWLWLFCLDPFAYLLPKTFKWFGFQYFRLWAYVMSDKCQCRNASCSRN